MKTVLIRIRVMDNTLKRNHNVNVRIVIKIIGVTKIKTSYNYVVM